MKPLFVIVHEELAFSPAVKEEITRIKMEEDFILIIGPTGSVPRNIPKNREIRVCGAFAELCVGIVCGSFKNMGYNAEIYKPASQHWYL